MKIRDKVIKLLGGYTEKEYNRIQNKYQALLDSKTDKKTVIIANEYMFRILGQLRRYIKSLYGTPVDEWARRVYNVICNNYFRLVIRYQKTDSVMPYVFDTTLDKDDEFITVLKDGGEYDEVEYILSNIVDND